MNHIVSIEVGDWSRDGHNQSEMFVYKANYSQSQIEAAYNTAVARGVPDVTSQCEEYEDCALGYAFASDWFKKANSTHPELLPLCQKIFQSSFFGVPGEPIDEEDETDLIRCEQLVEEYGYDSQARDHRIDVEDFVMIYLYTASTILKDLKYVEANDAHPLRIGGYGLFYG